MKYLSLLFLLFVACTPGPDARHSSMSGFVEICLHNHLYYAHGRQFQDNYAFAPRFNDDGTPKQCNSKDEEEE